MGAVLNSNLNHDTYSVKAVENLAGVNSNTLKAWERRYGAVVPKRLENGRRFYTNEDLTRVRILHELIKQGHAISSIAKRPTEDLRELLGGALSQISQISLSAGRVREVLSDEGLAIREKILQLLTNYEVEAVSTFLAAKRLQYSAKDFVLKIILPTMSDLTELIEAGILNIAQEHALSAIVKSELMYMYYTLTRSLSSLDKNHERQISVTISGMEGDFHEFGILSSAILFALAGIKSFYLGPHLPSIALAHAARSINTNLVVIGSTVLDPGIKKESIFEYISHIDRSLPKSTRIWIGGWNDAMISEIKTTREIRHIPSISELAQLISLGI